MRSNIKPSISVVIVNFNGRDFIVECIDTVLSSDYPDFEVVLVDNASVDDSWKLVNQRYKNNSKVRLIRSNKQLYFTGGYNLGCAKSSKDRLVLLNSDAVVDKNWLKEMVKVSKNDKKIIVQPKVINYANRRIIDNVGGIYNFWGLGKCRGRGEVDNGQYDKDCLIDYTVGTVFSIDRDFFMELGGFDEWYRYHYEDVDLCLRAKRQGGSCWYCYKAKIYHKGSLTVNKYVHHDELVYQIRKNRLETVIKNFGGFDRAMRLLTLTLVNSLLVLSDIFSLRPKRMTVTVRSIMAVAARHS